MNSKAVILVFISLALLVTTAQAQGKKNVCAITINSSDEINAMKKSLSADEFNFIELTEGSSKTWFEDSCDKGIQCDVLLISGHFAGQFFGTSNKTLSARTIEESSCTKKCDGILKRPKEVYLFGCNTLAGKNSDSRTPEQYFDVLISDGFSVPEAQQAVAFRYSPVGGSFFNRMSSSFNQTLRIYGFDSKSPLGKYSGPLFEKFLNKTPNYSSYLDNLNKDKNETILSIFKGTSMTQATGKAVLGAESVSPVCFLSQTNKANTRLEKLQWLKDALAGKFKMDYVLNASYFLRKEFAGKRFTSEEKAVLEQIRNTGLLKENLEKILNSEAHWLLRSKLEILEFYYYVGWVSQKDLSQKVISLLDLSNEKMTSDQMKYICAMDSKIDFDPWAFKSSIWKTTYPKYAISCLLPENSRIWKIIEDQGGF